MTIKEIKSILFDLQVIEDEINNDIGFSKPVWLYIGIECLTPNILSKKTMSAQYFIKLDRLIENKSNVGNLVTIHENTSKIDTDDESKELNKYIPRLTNLLISYKAVLEGKKVIRV